MSVMDLAAFTALSLTAAEWAPATLISCTTTFSDTGYALKSVRSMCIYVGFQAHTDKLSDW